MYDGPEAEEEEEEKMEVAAVLAEEALETMVPAALAPDVSRGWRANEDAEGESAGEMVDGEDGTEVGEDGRV
jgi:hypothetical protein